MWVVWRVLLARIERAPLPPFMQNHVLRGLPAALAACGLTLASLGCSSEIAHATTPDGAIAIANAGDLTPQPSTPVPNSAPDAGSAPPPSRPEPIAPVKADAGLAPETGAPPAPADASPVPAGPNHVAAVWAAGDSDTIERDSKAEPASSLVWDGGRIKLFGGRNEIVAFQLLVRATGDGITALGAGLPALTRRGGSEAITYGAPAADPSDARERPIQLFSVNYMDVQKGSNATWIYDPGSPGAPAKPTGLKPVQLVPENARAGKGGFPLSVRPGETQSLWFEIYTGRERPAGVYEGTVTITADGRPQNVPIELELLDFTLPDTNSLTAMVYYEGTQPERYQGRNLDPAYHRFAHRQRIELVDAYDAARVAAEAGRFDGRDFTPANGYEGPGQATGNRVVPASFYGPGSGWDSKTTAWQQADAWMSMLATKVPGAITFLYMPDEPSSSQFPGIRAIAENVHSNPGPGKDLPILVTHGYTGELEGAIDIWCSGPRQYQSPEASHQTSEGNAWWVYNGGRPAGAAITMDAPISDPREIGWAAFKAGQPGYFYWHGVHWHHNQQKKVGSKDQDVWGNPVTFDNRDAGGSGDFANGDGVLLYPGTEKLHPEQDRGIEGPIATTQLANLRRGLQDHLYLTMARRCGQDALVNETLTAIVPKVFDAAGSTVSFPQESAPYEAARLKLGRALAACPKP
jgi:hypothetical protein